MTERGYRNVLVVEDSDEDFEVIKRALLSVDPQIPIDRVDDGDAALDYLFAREGFEDVEPPGIVILDLHLPGVDGHEILALIRHDDALHTIPVIVLTSSSRQDDVESSYIEGANAHIEKSGRPNEFSRQVTALKTFWYGAVKLPA